MLELRSPDLLSGGANRLNVYGVNFGKARALTELGYYNAAQHDIGVGEIFNIITADIETTGITSQSQTRSISYMKRRARYTSDGAIEYLDEIDPSNVKTVHLSTRRMNQAQARYVNPDGTVEMLPLGEYSLAKEALPGETIVGGARSNLPGLAADASASDVARAQADEITKVLNEFTGYDETTRSIVNKVRLEGHNLANFDTKFLGTHLLSLHDQIEGRTKSRASSGFREICSAKGG
jgi:hypothetical protein